MKIILKTGTSKHWFNVPDNYKTHKSNGETWITIDQNFKDANDHIDFKYLEFDIEHRGLNVKDIFFDRKDYVFKNKISHSDYYMQFINMPEMKKALLKHFSKKAFLTSNDEHLNDIPLKKWDSFNSIPYIDQYKYRVSNNSYNGFFWSKSDNICLAKTYAYVLRKELKKESEITK